MSSPIFSILMPVWHPDPGHLSEAVESVINQTTSEWELIAVCDGPQPDEVMAVLRGSHPQIVIVERPEQGGIIAASADGLAAATGEFIALLDNDDVLPENALGSIAWELSRWPDVDFLYTDEDKLDTQGRRRRAYLKPAWSPERLRSNMYVGHLGVYRRELVNAVGGFRPGFDGSQDHDLALRVTEKARRIVHVPRICYHWRESETSTALDPGAKDWAFDAGVRAVASHMERTGVPATAERRPLYPGFIKLVPNEDHDFGLISIIIPTSGGSKLVEGTDIGLIDNAITSIVTKSTYKNIEIVVVLDANGSDATSKRIKSLAPELVRVVRDQKPFSFSGACNLGARRATGPTLLFLNDDTEVITPEWLERLALHAQLPGVGAVGARLEYPDGRIQHGGVVSRGGGAAHLYAGSHGDNPGYYGELITVTNTIAVTGACLAVTRSNFESVGGFSRELPLNFNDIDLCLKLLRRGLRNVFDSDTKLVHYESVSREPVVHGWEHAFVLDRWWNALNHDPYDNPNRAKTSSASYAPPEALLKLRELQGDVHHGRSWPLEAPTFRYG